LLSRVPARSQFNGVDAVYLNGAYKPMLDRRTELERVGFDHSARADMLRTAARLDLELRVFIPPSHARQAEIVRFLGLEPLFRQWLRELIRIPCTLSRRTGRAIVDTVLGFPPSELAEDQTFGVQVAPASIDEHFEHRHIDRARYLAANPEIEAEIAELYRGKPVSRVQPDALAALPKPCVAILARGEIAMQ
jgi:hypothetical protein